MAGERVTVELTYDDWRLLHGLIQKEAKRLGYREGFTERSQFTQPLKRLYRTAGKLIYARYPEPLKDNFNKVDFSKYKSIEEIWEELNEQTKG